MHFHGNPIPSGQVHHRQNLIAKELSVEDRCKHQEEIFHVHLQAFRFPNGVLLTRLEYI